MTLVNDLKQPGVHAATLTADDLASGLYFVRLETLEKTAVERIVLMR